MSQQTSPVCLVCGKPNPGKQRLYCSKRCCSTATSRRARSGSILPPAKSAPAGFQPAKCPLDCRYLMAYQHNQDYSHHCGYILMTGRSRGCDPGRGCTRYKTKRRNKRNEKE